ncbi:MAG: helix-turn-helix transcriptional regulator [Naasia sp.]
MAELLLNERYEATDTDAATTAIQSVLGVGTVTAGGTGFRYVQQSLVDDGISATRIASTGDGVLVRSVAAPDLVVVSVRGGSVELTQEPGPVTLAEGDLGVVCLGSAAELRWDHAVMDLYSFPPAAIGRLLGSDARQLRLRCERLVPKSVATAGLWHRTAGVLVSEILQKHELFESDIIREQAIDALLAVAVEAFGISDIAEDDATSDERLLARAEEFMTQHLADPITIPDVARAVGVSLRGLQVMFRRRGEGTPLLHLRQLRMEAARRELSAPGARRTTSVGAVARGLSYSNLGRFSAHYRETFGESPVETLRA